MVGYSHTISWPTRHIFIHCNHHSSLRRHHFCSVCEVNKASNASIRTAKKRENCTLHIAYELSSSSSHVHGFSLRSIHLLMICYAAALLLTLLPLHHFYHHGLKSRHRQFSSIHRSSDEQAEQQQQVHTSFIPNISSSNSRQLSCILHISTSICTKCSEWCWYTTMGGKTDNLRDRQVEFLWLFCCSCPFLHMYDK